MNNHSVSKSMFLQPHMLLLLAVMFVARIQTVQADDQPIVYPTNLTVKAAFIPGETFGDFQRDLLARLQLFALDDNVTLTFTTEYVQLLYNSNLALIAPECHDSVFVEGIEYDCSDYDIIIGDYWPNPDRYLRVDFTPAWLSTSISAIKYLDKTKNPQLDVTTLTEASLMKSNVCALKDSYTGRVVEDLFPNVNVVGCMADGSDGCMNMLKAERCSLWVSDELVLRKEQADDPTLAMTGEQLERQFLAWPVRRSLDPTVKFLLNKWMYAAISDQHVNELYFDYFEKKLCPVGTAGKDCEMPCDPDHGISNPRGECICESARWAGDDCSIEVPEEMNEIPYTTKVVAFSMFGLNVLVITLCAAWLYWQRDSPQVSVSQPFFLLLVLLGCLISSSTIIALAQEEVGEGNDPNCMAIPWLYSIGFSVTFGTLFAKVRRVYMIFTQECALQSFSTERSSTRLNRVSVKDTLFFIGVLVFIDAVILVSWTVIDPMEWERFALREDIYGDILESQGRCVSDSGNIFKGLIAALHLGLLGIASYMCCVARNIPTKYSEHKYVSIAMLSNLQIFVVGVPVLVMVRGDPETTFFVASVIVWMNDLAVVTLIFGNLMYNVYRSPGGSFHGSQEDKAKLGLAVRRYSSSRMTRGRQNRSDEFSVTQEAPQSPVTPVTDTRPLETPQRIPRISSLSIGSAQEISERPARSVSFNEHVTVSEYDETATRDSHERFAPPQTQGSPNMPRRHSYQDGILTKPVRIPSSFDVQVGSESMDASANSSDQDPPQHALNAAGQVFVASLRSDPIDRSQRSSGDCSIPLPTRKPSDYCEDSDRNDESLSEMSPTRKHHSSPPILPARPPSIFESSDNFNDPMREDQDQPKPDFHSEMEDIEERTKITDPGQAFETTSSRQQNSSPPRLPARPPSIFESSDNFNDPMREDPQNLEFHSEIEEIAESVNELSPGKVWPPQICPPITISKTSNKRTGTTYEKPESPVSIMERNHNGGVLTEMTLVKDSSRGDNTSADALAKPKPVSSHFEPHSLNETSDLIFATDDGTDQTLEESSLNSRNAMA